MLIPKNRIEWKKVRYLKTPWQLPDDQARWDYELWLNEPLASWDVFPYWERERVESMRSNLKNGDVLFDVGTESGWCNLVYAKIVGPENMVLIEPTPEFWPNIQALWEKNFDTVQPLACFQGFFSNATTKKLKVNKGGSWPTCSNGDLIDKNSYRYLSEQKHKEEVSQITIDDYIAKTGIMPAAITIDVEGAELLVLQGAKKTLKQHSIKVWVSEHDDLMLKGFGIKPHEVSDFMAQLGYSGTVLATDHERHVLYTKI